MEGRPNVCPQHGAIAADGNGPGAIKAALDVTEEECAAGIMTSDG